MRGERLPALSVTLSLIDDIVRNPADYDRIYLGNVGRGERAVALHLDREGVAVELLYKLVRMRPLVCIHLLTSRDRADVCGRVTRPVRVPPADSLGPTLRSRHSPRELL